jgi:hypothetical protein
LRSQLGVFLQLSQSLGLFQLQPAMFFPPPVERLLDDPRFLARHWHRLALAHQHFNLPQLPCDLLWRKGLLRHLPSLLSVLRLSIRLVQKLPVRSVLLRGSLANRLFRLDGAGARPEGRATFSVRCASRRSKSEIPVYGTTSNTKISASCGAFVAVLT